jgi:hypothetical protein
MKKLMFVLSFVLFAFFATPSSSFAAASEEAAEPVSLAETELAETELAKTESPTKVEDTCIDIYDFDEFILIVIYEC